MALEEPLACEFGVQRDFSFEQTRNRATFFRLVSGNGELIGVGVGDRRYIVTVDVVSMLSAVIPC